MKMYYYRQSSNSILSCKAGIIIILTGHTIGRQQFLHDMAVRERSSFNVNISKLIFSKPANMIPTSFDITSDSIRDLQRIA